MLDLLVEGGTCVEGRVSARCRHVAIFNSAFLVGSPDSKHGMLDEGGAVRMVIMSTAAYRRNSSRFTLGMGNGLGKKVTVSISRSARVEGK